MPTSRRWIEAVTLPEVPLQNGDVTKIVVRVGDTVRRPAGRDGTPRTG